MIKFLVVLLVIQCALCSPTPGMLKAFKNAYNNTIEYLKEVKNRIGQGCLKPIIAKENSTVPENPDYKDLYQKSFTEEEKRGLTPLVNIADGLSIDNVKIKKYAELSGMSYCSISQIQQIGASGKLRVGRFELIDHAEVDKDKEGSGPVYSIKTSTNEAIIVFRGTVRIREWISNMNFLGNPVDPVFGQFPNTTKVHAGFQNHYLKLRPQIQRIVNSTLATNPSKIILAGHRYVSYCIVTNFNSLGGAMAYLNGIDMLTNLKQKVSGIFTYGAPMLGNQDLVNIVWEKMDKKIVPVTNKNDLIPFLGLSPNGGIFPEQYFYGENRQSYVKCFSGDLENDYCNQQYSCDKLSTKSHVFLGSLPIGSGLCAAVSSNDTSFPLAFK
jgi:hypothetical protein